MTLFGPITLALEPAIGTYPIHKIDDDHKQGKDWEDQITVQKFQDIHKNNLERERNKKWVIVYFLNFESAFLVNSDKANLPESSARSVSSVSQ